MTFGTTFLVIKTFDGKNLRRLVTARITPSFLRKNIFKVTVKQQLLPRTSQPAIQIPFAPNLSQLKEHKPQNVAR